MRLIDADKLLRKQYEIYVPEDPEAWFGQSFTHKVVSIEDIKKAPTIEAEPVKHGRWNYNARACDLECSLCGEVSYRTNYCPNCGAKMQGGADHED